MDCPNCNGGANSFRGSAFRADLVMQRDSRHIEIKIFTEDDTTWTEKMRVNSHWVPELISILQVAQDYMEKNLRKDPSGFGYVLERLNGNDYRRLYNLKQKEMARSDMRDQNDERT